jgi:hypothetical protein
MCPLRRVEGRQAGPTALGILAPPGRRTFLILRPRSLSWDLLLSHREPDGTFRDLRPEEAARLSGELFDALSSWSAGASGHIEEIARPDGGFWLRVCVGPFSLLLCEREPGQPYRPLTFPDAETALAVAGRLRPILCPSGSVEQEVYLNTRYFTS